MIDYQALAAEIALPAYAQYLPDDTSAICALLNAQTDSMPKETFVNERTIFARLGLVAGPLLDKLDVFIAGAAPTDQIGSLLHNATKRLLKFVYSEAGLDFGHPNSQSQLDALAMIGVLTVGEVAALKNLGFQPASRAEILFGVGSSVTDEDIRAAQGV